MDEIDRRIALCASGQRPDYACRIDTWFAWRPVQIGALGGPWRWLRRLRRDRCMGVTTYQDIAESAGIDAALAAWDRLMETLVADMQERHDREHTCPDEPVARTNGSGTAVEAVPLDRHTTLERTSTMPSMMGQDDMENHALPGRNFNFSATRIESLGATSYTIVTIAGDGTGSMMGFEEPVVDMMRTAIRACEKSPRRENLLARTLIFSDRFPGGVEEIHGFKPLGEIDTASYALVARGQTPLCDAAYSAIGAANAYAKRLTDLDYLVNAITFIVSDGGENASTATMKMVREETEKALKGEIMESHVTILIGIDTGRSSAADLKAFKEEAGITQFLDLGAATPQRLAKLAEFVSHSVSSQSQSLGTGGPSQQIQATI